MKNMEIKAEKIVFGGECLGYIDGKTVFVSGMLPGEVAEIKIIQTKKDYDKAVATKIIESSPFRTTPKCKYYGKCGGCNLQIATEEYQRQLRTEILTDCFKRGLGNDLFTSNCPKIELIYDKPYEYRNRFQFTKGGLQEKSQNNAIKIDECLIGNAKVNSLLKANAIPVTQDRLFVFDDKTSLDTSDYTVNILGKPITFDVRGFFQSNLGMLEKTIPLLIDGFENLPQSSDLLDMYSGVGTLSAFAACFFDRTTLVEHNKKALFFASKNLCCNDSSKIKTFSMTGEKWVTTKAAKANYDAVIIDPPRSGIEKPVLSWLCNKKVPIIRSLSCDPVTHARDAKKLLEAGYKMTKLFLLDFYSQTSHIETLAHFEL